MLEEECSSEGQGLKSESLGRGGEGGVEWDKVPAGRERVNLRLVK